MEGNLRPSGKIWLDIAIIISGFISIVGQSVLIRELTCVFYGNELSLGVILFSWLFWMAVGSFGIGRFVDRIGPKVQIFVLTQILVSFLLPLTLFAVRSIKLILGVFPGELIGYSAMVMVTFVILAPICIVIGFQFTLSCKIYSRILQNAPKAVGKIYIYDTIGDMLGGFAFGYIFINIFHSFQTLFYVLPINLIGGLALAWAYCKRRILLKGIIGLSILLNIWCIIQVEKIDRLTTSFSWKGFTLVETATSRYSNLTLIKQGDLYSLYQNGILSFTNPSKMSSEELIHFSLLEVRNPKRVLVVSDAVSGALQEILKYPVEEVYYVELDPAILSLAKPYITKSDLQALKDERVKLIHTDGRFFIKRFVGRPFDCIIINVGDPSTAEKNKFYTIEFFQEIRSILDPNGVVTLCVWSNENYLGRTLLEFNGCIYHTLKHAFPNIVLVPGERLFLIASSSDDFLTNDPNVLSRRFNQYGIKTRFVNEYYLPYRFYLPRMEYIRKTLDNFKEARINRDLYPVCYYFDMTLWGAQFSKTVEKIFLFLYRIRIGWITVFICTAGFLLWLLRRQVGRSFVPLVVFSVGAAGIVIEIVLVIGFQVLYGYIYHMIGIIIASFMLGIVLGTGWMNRRLDWIKDKILTLALLELTYAGYLILLPGIFQLLKVFHQRVFIQFSIQILFPTLTVLAGLWVGMIFPLAIKIYLKDEKTIGRTTGILYALDLGGACVGSLLVSILLIPIFGIPKSCMLLSLLNIVSFVLLSSIRKA
ncbi:MAG: fused MFS/spermidine synthase [bacterium]|nr:fused MFS/spermidine synthase [bacterium]